MHETYYPDHAGLETDKIEIGVRIIQGTQVGIEKCVEIRLSPNNAEVVLTHCLKNSGLVAANFSPWAITIFRLGGTVILPQLVGNADQQGLLNNRIMALWPYTHINDTRLILRDDLILFHAKPDLPMLKIGYFNLQERLANWLDGCLFYK